MSAPTIITPGNDSNPNIDLVTFLHEELRFYDGGVYISSIVDRGADGATWDTISWDMTTGGGTSLQSVFSVQSCSNATACSDTDWSTVNNSGDDVSGLTFVNDSDRYLRYKLSISGGDENSTPILNSVNIAYGKRL